MFTIMCIGTKEVKKNNEGVLESMHQHKWMSPHTGDPTKFQIDSSKAINESVDIYIKMAMKPKIMSQTQEAGELSVGTHKMQAEKIKLISGWPVHIGENKNDKE